ncbi:glycosyltransferase family 2 protein [Vibrio tasmaniensis]|uniref:glycosyltransferase family 2 protein n=1 Tax=Vibrio tasmaniensis TaxID=212663 RepID=UPI001118E987|nr:hypothetical protein [Vibrio tasmaniensis]
MLDISFCIILYNKDLSQSATISSLQSILPTLPYSSRIVVFNNGPNIQIDPNQDGLDLHNVLVNASLAKLYNKFVDAYDSKFYVFLDDDTILNSDYIQEFFKANSEIFFPKIYCNGELHYPCFDSRGVQTITSGLVLNKLFIHNIENEKVFDERFLLYGIDTAFCYQINREGVGYEVSESILEHDLSHISGGGSDFRNSEVLYANCASLISYFSFKLALQIAIGIGKQLMKGNLRVLKNSVIFLLLRRVVR